MILACDSEACEGLYAVSHAFVRCDLDVHHLPLLGWLLHLLKLDRLNLLTAS
jgi:hypothetical protein